MEHVRELLSEFVDGTLSEPRAREVRLHLKECGECQAGLEELGSISRMLQGLPRRPLPRGFMARLEHRISPKPRASFLLGPKARMAAFALSSLLVMFLAYEQLKPRAPLSSGLQETDALQEAQAPAVMRKALESARKEQAPPPKPLARAKGKPIGPGEEAGALSGAPDQAAGGLGKTEGLRYTNEDLHRDLEAQKARMGIREIVPTRPRRALAETAAARGREGQDFAVLIKAPPAPRLPGGVPAMLSTPRRQAAKGAPLAEPEPLGAPKAAGALIRSEEERRGFWRRNGLQVEPPPLDYSREMLVVVLPEDGLSAEVAEIKTSPDRILVRYRLSSSPAPLPMLEAIPRTGLPVVFERVP